MESPSIKLQMDKKSFDTLYETKISQSETNEKAYEASEEEHEKLTGSRRYSSYDSYRRCRYDRIKKKR